MIGTTVSAELVMRMSEVQKRSRNLTIIANDEHGKVNHP